jgi:hypothetical protein
LWESGPGAEKYRLRRFGTALGARVAKGRRTPSAAECCDADQNAQRERETNARPQRQVHVPAVRAGLSLSIRQQVGKRGRHIGMAMVAGMDVTGTMIVWRHQNFLPSLNNRNN